jgi:HlyD family secretion protein
MMMPHLTPALKDRLLAIKRIAMSIQQRLQIMAMKRIVMRVKNSPIGAAATAWVQVSIRRHLWASFAILLLLVIGAGGWAAEAELSGALIAPGSVVVDSNVKKIQHQTGGTVAALLARDGDHVKAGDILVRLDDTVAKANLAIVSKGLDELVARKARLASERDGVQQIIFPADLLKHMGDSDAASAVDGERKLFELRRMARAGQRAQLRQRIEQLRQEIIGQEAEQIAKSHEIELINGELEGVRDLYKKNLVPLSRLNQLERDATHVEADRAQLIAATAQSKGKISEIELQIIQIDQDLSSEVGKEMREIDAKIGEFVERKITAEDQLKHIDIRAPLGGTVFESNVHTVGGVIAAGDQIMRIVPDADRLTVEAKVQPQDIDQVQVGQSALLRFTNFNTRTTPEIHGKVMRVSADTSTDQRSGVSYYTIRISLATNEIAKLGDIKLMPGMPVEAFVQTGERTLISYLAKPLSDQFMRAFRER